MWARAMNGQVCSICHDHAFECGPMQWLACGHVFHHQCVTEYMRVTNIPDLDLLACPVCKLTGESCLQREAALKEQQRALACPPTESISSSSSSQEGARVLTPTAALVHLEHTQESTAVLTAPVVLVPTQESTPAVTAPVALVPTQESTPAEEQPLARIPEETEEKWRPIGDETETGIYCESCKMLLNGPVQWSDHIIGKKHKKHSKGEKRKDKSVGHNLGIHEWLEEDLAAKQSTSRPTRQDEESVAAKSRKPVEEEADKETKSAGVEIYKKIETTHFIYETFCLSESDDEESQYPC